MNESRNNIILIRAIQRLLHGRIKLKSAITTIGWVGLGLGNLWSLLRTQVLWSRRFFCFMKLLLFVHWPELPQGGQLLWTLNLIDKVSWILLFFPTPQACFWCTNQISLFFCARSKTKGLTNSIPKRENLSNPPNILSSSGLVGTHPHSDMSNWKCLKLFWLYPHADRLALSVLKPLYSFSELSCELPHWILCRLALSYSAFLLHF